MHGWRGERDIDESVAEILEQWEDKAEPDAQARMRGSVLIIEVFGRALLKISVARSG